jgi:hypothetical protein
MTIIKARIALLCAFMIAFAIQISAFVFAYLGGRIYSDEVQALVLLLTKIYSVPLAVVIAGLFTEKNNRRKATHRPLFGIALVLCLVWNVLLLWRSLVFGFGRAGTDVELTDYLNTITSASSWLIAGVLSFFFVREQTPK